ncbi:unnamed protein product [Camellia sinensis]
MIVEYLPVAALAMDDMIAWMQEGGQVGIFYATNSTRKRRNMLMKMVEGKCKSGFATCAIDHQGPRLSPSTKSLALSLLLLFIFELQSLLFHPEPDRNRTGAMATLVPPTATAPPPSKPTVVPPEKVDYLNLPCPIPYEEIHREALMSFKPELFEGMRFDFTKGLNQKFSLSHSVFMGPTEIPSQSSETIKIPTAHYEFGANFIDPKLILFGRILTDVSSRFHYYKAQWCFAGTDFEAGYQDFKKRVENYEKVYEPVEEGSYIKMIDMVSGQGGQIQ